MKGRRCALAKASATIGDESVRMALPMDIKKLYERSHQLSYIMILSTRLHLPKGGSGPRHILRQSPHNAVWSGTVSKYVHSSYRPWISRPSVVP